MKLESWISLKTVKGLPSKIHGKGFFAQADIEKDEIVAIKSGHIIDKATLEKNKTVTKGSECQISNTMYLAPLQADEVEDLMIYANHSCEPNVGLGGNIFLIAMRDIKTGEELTIDHAMHLSDPDYSMQCNCQTPSCRHHITGNDWMEPELQQKYKGYFVWYLALKIEHGSTPTA